MNFTKQPKRIGAFIGSKEVDAILLELSTQIKGANFVPGRIGHGTGLPDQLQGRMCSR